MECHPPSHKATADKQVTKLKGEQMECHRCEHRAAVEAGQYERMAFEETPCGKCDLTENSDYTIDYDFEREVAREEAKGKEEPDSLKQDIQGLGFSFDEADTDDNRVPLSIMREIVMLLLTMPKDVRDAVCWRYAGLEYRDVAKLQNVTLSGVEARHRRALVRWPILKALFPEKVARQERKKMRMATGRRRILEGKKQ